MWVAKKTVSISCWKFPWPICSSSTNGTWSYTQAHTHIQPCNAFKLWDICYIFTYDIKMFLSFTDKHKLAFFLTDDTIVLKYIHYLYSQCIRIIKTFYWQLQLLRSFWFSKMLILRLIFSLFIDLRWWHKITIFSPDKFDNAGHTHLQREAFHASVARAPRLLE